MIVSNQERWTIGLDLQFNLYLVPVSQSLQFERWTAGIVSDKPDRCEMIDGFASLTFTDPIACDENFIKLMEDC